MSAAVPGIPRVKRAAKVAVALVAAALVGSACAPQSAPPDIPVSFGDSDLLTQVVDQVYDVGRSPSVGLNEGGDPSIAYLLLQPKLKKGAIPPPLLANTPQPPSVVLASEESGVWTRRNVTANEEGGGKGTAAEIADKDGFYDGQATVALAVDGKGFHHVAWSTPSGVFYAADQAVKLGGDKETLAFGGDPQEVASGSALGVSIAVSEDGTPWIAYLSGGHVDVATLSGTKWAVTEVDIATSGGVAMRTAIALVQGKPLVTYQAPGGLTIAAPTELGNMLGMGGTTEFGWASEPIADAGSPALGLSMVVPASAGQPVLAFIQSNGQVSVAARAGTARWTVARAGNVGTSVEGGADPTALTAGLGSDSAGNLWLAWPNLTDGTITLARGSVSALSFRPTDVPESLGGWSPSVAVAEDGKHAAVTWYDSVNRHLMVASLVQGPPEVAIPSPSFSPFPSPSPSGALPCFPTGSTDLTIDAPSGAAGSGFSTTCLAVKPDTDFTVAFDNADQAPHNFAIYTDSQATKLLGGATSATDIVAPGASTTYQVSGLPTGTYFFRCDVHPTTMTGQFVVTAKKAPAGAPSPTPTPSASPSA
jgi:plastocyanin